MFRYQDGNCPVKAFVDDLPEGERSKLLVLLRHIDGKKGMIWNREKFKLLEGEKGRNTEQFYEIKSFQVRIGCIFEGGRKRLILLYGFKKKSNDWPRGEVQRLHNVYNDFDDERRKRR